MEISKYSSGYGKADIYQSFIYDNLAYDIIIKDDFIKLEKIPGIPEEWMGINEFTEIKEYIFFILLITFLEDKNKEEQFILSSITEYIEHNYDITLGERPNIDR